MNMHLYLRNRKCELCKWYRLRANEEPCKSCKQRINPKEPADRLIINDVPYVREEQEHESSNQ